jgi:hypothetical protein
MLIYKNVKYIKMLIYKKLMLNININKYFLIKC